MTRTIVNKDLIPGNLCFGCGHANDRGLKIDVWVDEQTRDTVRGSLTPEEHMIGFPGLIHGGVVFTALDCMSTWAPTALRRDVKAAWVLRSAQVTYHAPAHPGKPLRLSTTIVEEGAPLEAKRIRGEARDENDTLVVECQFKVIPLEWKRFRQIAAVDEIPENYLKVFEDDGAPE